MIRLWARVNSRTSIHSMACCISADSAGAVRPVRGDSDICARVGGLNPSQSAVSRTDRRLSLEGRRKRARFRLAIKCADSHAS